jgi:hypothetical protein
LIGGVICALAIVAGEKGMFGRNRLPLEFAAMIVVAALSVAGAIAVA